jgi:hypothetical protein
LANFSTNAKENLLSSERPQSDYAETRYIDVPQEFEGILGEAQAACVEGVEENQTPGRVQLISLRKTYQNNYCSICTIKSWLCS